MILWVLAIMLLAIRSSAFRSLPRPARLALKVQMSGVGHMFLQVPFEERETVKGLGAKWNIELKKWYIPEGSDPKPFAKWRKVHLQVPFSDKDEVKKLGATWDPMENKWCISGALDMAPFMKWIEGVSPKTADTLSQESNSASASKAPYKRYAPKAGSPASSPSVASTSSSSSPSSAPAASASGPRKVFAKEITSHNFGVSRPSPSPDAAAAQAEAPEISAAPSETVLLVDCDTNGLPQDIRSSYPPYTSLKSYDSARIVQLSFALCNKSNLDTIATGSFIIKSDGFPIDNSEFHGITPATSSKRGVDFKQAASALLALAKKTDTILCHNAEFVSNVVKSELFRHVMLDDLHEWEQKTELCSMLGLREVLNLPDKAGNVKAVSLKELVRFALKEDLPQMHNSEVDVFFLRRALQMLVRDKLYTIAK